MHGVFSLHEYRPQGGYDDKAFGCCFFFFLWTDGQQRNMVIDGGGGWPKPTTLYFRLCKCPDRRRRTTVSVSLFFFFLFLLSQFIQPQMWIKGARSKDLCEQGAVKCPPRFTLVEDGKNQGEGKGKQGKKRTVEIHVVLVQACLINVLFFRVKDSKSSAKWRRIRSLRTLFSFLLPWSIVSAGINFVQLCALFESRGLDGDLKWMDGWMGGKFFLWSCLPSTLAVPQEKR